MRVIEVFMYGRRCAYYQSFLQERKRGGTPSLNFAAAKIGVIDGPFIMAVLLLIEDCFSFGSTPILSGIDNIEMYNYRGLWWPIFLYAAEVIFFKLDGMKDIIQTMDSMTAEDNGKTKKSAILYGISMLVFGGVFLILVIKILT